MDPIRDIRSKTPMTLYALGLLLVMQEDGLTLVEALKQAKAPDLDEHHAEYDKAANFIREHQKDFHITDQELGKQVTNKELG